MAKESEDAMRKRILKQQIFERQRDLFGVEMPKREYDFSYEMQDKILEFFKKENPSFKESLKYFKKSYRGLVTKENSVIIRDKYVELVDFEIMIKSYFQNFCLQR